MKTLDLKGKWQLIQINTQESCSANIPGDNYSALLAAGRIPDPYYRINEKDVQWVRDCDWEYRREFNVSDELLQYGSVYLNLEMVDTLATIMINGKKVIATENMFRRYRPEVKKFLKAGINQIQVVFRSVVKESVKEVERQPMLIPSSGCNTIKNLNLFRKVQCHGGWDWGVTLMVSGIYGDISLHGVDNTSLEYVYDVQRHEKGSCKVTAVAEINACKKGKVAVTFELNGEKIVKQINADAGMNVVKAEFTVAKPKLWWPAGYGEQPLYPLTVSTADETVTRQIGLRKVEVIRETDEIGQSMFFRVNGVDIFCKGANWIPADGMPERQTAAVYEDLLESARLANMNMVRVWGGGQFEKDEFYEMCDRKGIMIWHDMMFACSLYPSTPWFLANVKEEVTYQIKRLRHHASIALWCGDNEVIGALGWYKEARDSKSAYVVNYDRLNRVLGEAVESCDPERLFWPSSPCGGPGQFNDGWHDDTRGDMHYWSVWHSREPFESYYKVKPRFCSEFGFQSLSSFEVVNTFAAEKDFNVFSPVMDHHQKCHHGNVNTISMFAKYFRMPEGFENFLYLSQAQQAMAIKTAVEFWRLNRPRCMGTIYWQLNDNWPVASWASIEYGGHWKQLQYHARRFFNPSATFALQRDGEVEIWAVNDRTVAQDFKISVRICELDGNVSETMQIDVRIPAGTSKKVKTFKVEKLKAAPEELFMVMDTTVGDNVLRNTHFFAAFKACSLVKANVKTEIKTGKDGATVTLTTDKPAFFVSLEPLGVNGIFSDNSITLMPGETVTVSFAPKGVFDADKFRKGLTVKHLRETYI